MDLNISAVFPAYNEESNLQRLIQEADSILSRLCLDYEILLINDGSTDSTAEIASSLSEEHPRVNVIHHHKNMGYGAALKTGFHNAAFPWIFFADSDLQFDISELTYFARYVDEYDFIIGYRKDRQDGFGRKLNAYCWGKLVQRLFKFSVKDIDCAFKLMRRSAVLQFQLETDGAMISTELLAKAFHSGARIKEIGVTHFPRQCGKQGGASFCVIVTAFIELYKMYGRLQRTCNLYRTRDNLTLSRNVGAES